MAMKRLFLAFLLALLPLTAQSLTLQEGQAEADAWVAANWTAIRNRVVACLGEAGGPEKCHTAWAASEANYCANNAGSGPSLCAITLDDPGTFDTSCGGCYTGNQSFANAGINIPANLIINATINIAEAPGGGRGEQLIVAFQYDGAIWEKGYGDAILPGFDWQLRP